MGKTTKQALTYKGYRLEPDNGNGWLACKHSELVAGGDTLKELKHTLDKMIEQNVKHESELKDEQ